MINSPLLVRIFLFTIIIFLKISLLILLIEGTSLILEWEIFNMNSLRITFPLFFDKLRLRFSLTVLLISFRVILFTSSYISKDPQINYFVIIVILFVFSINLLIFSPNILTILLGWDGLGLTSYLLVIYYSNEKSIGAGILTAITNRIGDSLLIVLGTFLLTIGHWNLMFEFHRGFPVFALLIIFAAFTKRAQLPFRAWLPAAMAAPTPVSALVHSSTLVTAGVYLLIRTFSRIRILRFSSDVIFFRGMRTCLMASLAASLEWDIKKIIALSTLSQLGVMIISLGLNQPNLAFFHLLTHALFKAVLFISAGNIIHSTGNSQDIRLLGNIRQNMPFRAATFNAANLSLCGLPFLSGFYSKDLIVEFAFRGIQPVVTTLLIIFRICLTSIYTIKLSIITLWNERKNTAVNRTLDKRKILTLSCFPLLVGAIFGGRYLEISYPQMENLNLPFFLKVAVLRFIVILGMLIYFITKKLKIFSWLKHFISRMWFLTFISANTPLNVSLVLREKILYNESTWLEYFRFKGLFSKIYLTQISKINMPIILSLIAFLIILIYCYHGVKTH